MKNEQIKKYSDRSKQEQDAIDEYIKESHPTNIPKNIDKHPWVFFKNRDKLRAGA